MAKVLWILVATCVWSGVTQVTAKSQDTSIGNEPPRPEAVAALRADGPDGLARALSIYDGLRREQSRLMLACSTSPGEQLTQVKRDVEAWSAAIDQIGTQRDCTVSRLYWYTDLDKAKAEAKRTNRPILSLRMLGKLTDEYSCANSRFFRTALYSNKQVSDFLRANYILHWQSVRPVPKVTIDFGDGRKLERTLTGNSAHYALSADGTPLDVLPGLYGPLAFTQWLWDLRMLQLEYDKTPLSDRPSKLRAFHARSRDELLRKWDFDIQRLGEQRADLVQTRITGALASARLEGRQVPADPAPKAVKAAARAVSKTLAEGPILRFAKVGGTWMERGMDDDTWQGIANLHRDDVKLDEASVALMRKEIPAAVAMRVAVSKARQEDPVLRMVRTFESSITLDQVRNEYLLHRRVHELLASKDAVTIGLDSLNEWVYSELFLTPSSDPWLGLAPRDVYTALDNGGQTEPARQTASGAGG
ncbi:MAG TPA: hypothetical protein VFW73_03225 [Lacipirellulaceae bacterium]|nr:hypothetical protein [Lacipirellulaceae bacterium]